MQRWEIINHFKTIIGNELWQITIIGTELWCDHLNNEPAVYRVLNLIIAINVSRQFTGRFRHVNIFQQYINDRKDQKDYLGGRSLFNFCVSKNEDSE